MPKWQYTKTTISEHLYKCIFITLFWLPVFFSWTDFDLSICQAIRFCTSPKSQFAVWIFTAAAQKTYFTKVNGLPNITPLVSSVEETPEPIPTTVKGTIPTWIHGSLLRNGPGKFEFGNQQWVRTFNCQYGDFPCWKNLSEDC